MQFFRLHHRQRISGLFGLGPNGVSKVTSTICVACTLAACASLSAPGAHVVLDHEANISSPTGLRKTLLPGEGLQITEAILLVESDGKNSAYIVPVWQNETLKLNLKPQREVVTPGILREVGDLLSETENLADKIDEDRLKAASESLIALKTKYPGFAYLGFIEASIRLLEGNKKESLQALSDALKAHPKNVRGRSLYRELSGRDWDGNSGPTVLPSDTNLGVEVQP